MERGSILSITVDSRLRGACPHEGGGMAVGEVAAFLEFLGLVGSEECKGNGRSHPHLLTICRNPVPIRFDNLNIDLTFAICLTNKTNDRIILIT